MNKSSPFKDEKRPESNLSEDPGKATREYLKQLWKLLVKHSRWDNLSAGEPVSPPDKAPLKAKRPKLLLILKGVPWLLAFLFLLSFLWDFNNLQLQILGTVYPLDGLMRIVSVSGMIGFLTNWLAITMLFKPVNRRPLLGHGLIPAHKDRIAFRLAAAVSKDLINPEIIKQKIHQSGVISRYRVEATRYLKSVIDNPEFRADIKQWVVEYVDAMIADPGVRTAIAQKMLTELDESLEQRSLEKVALKTYTFLKGKEMQEIIEESLDRLPSTVEKGLVRMDELLDRLPEYIDSESDQIENIVTLLLYHLVNQLDVFALVEENIKKYNEGRLEQLIKGATNEQLRYIQYLGAVLGTIGGLVIWEPLLSLTILSLLFLLIVSTDKLLLSYKLRHETNSRG